MIFFPPSVFFSLWLDSILCSSYRTVLNFRGIGLFDSCLNRMFTLMVVQADEAEDEDADEDRPPDGDAEGRREKYVGVKVKVSCVCEA